MPLKLTNGKRGYLVALIAITCGSFIYRLISSNHLEQTSLLFLGIPMVLGIVVVLVEDAETLVGSMMRIITLSLCLAAPLLGEGFICILFAAPLFYLVGLIIVFIVSFFRDDHAGLYCCALVLFPLCLEGVSPYLSFPREEVVTVTRTVTATPADVERALSSSPRISKLPAFLRIGFPRPVEAHGAGLKVGDLRVIRFAGGEGHPGDLTMRVAAASPGRILFFVDSDHSKIAHWLDWRSSDVSYTAIDATHTQVTWKIGFTRRLDPAWYFRPWERYTVQKAAEYLIEANATPEKVTP